MQNPYKTNFLSSHNWLLIATVHIEKGKISAINFVLIYQFSKQRIVCSVSLKVTTRCFCFCILNIWTHTYLTCFNLFLIIILADTRIVYIPCLLKDLYSLSFLHLFCFFSFQTSWMLWGHIFVWFLKLEMPLWFFFFFYSSSSWIFNFYCIPKDS